MVQITSPNASQVLQRRNVLSDIEEQVKVSATAIKVINSIISIRCDTIFTYKSRRFASLSVLKAYNLAVEATNCAVARFCFEFVIELITLLAVITIYLNEYVFITFLCRRLPLFEE